MNVPIKQNENKKKLGIFIDGANMYYASKKAGWRLSFEKIKKLFGSIYDLIVLNYYIALPDELDSERKKTEDHIKAVSKYVKVVTKPLKYIDGKKKGNVDIEITIDIVRNLDNLDEIIIFTGDSDYFELWKFVFVEKRKSLRFVSYKRSLAYELKKTKYLILEKIRKFVELKGEKDTPDLAAGRTLTELIIDEEKKMSSDDVEKKFPSPFGEERG